jgi:hypothetical protein
MINKQKIALHFFSHMCLDYSISFNNTFRTVMCEGWHFSRMWKTLAYDNCTSSLREEFRVHMRGGFIRYIGPWPGEPIMDTWISEGPHSLSHKRFILIFPFFGGVFLRQTLNIGSKSSLVPPWKISIGGLGLMRNTKILNLEDYILYRLS